SSRLARGRALLARRLARFAPGLSAVALAALLSRESSAAVPAALAEATVSAAACVAAGNPAAGPAPGGALTEGGLRAMWMNRVKVAAGVVLAAVLLVLGATPLVPRAAADKPAPAKDDKPAGAKDAKPEVGPTVQGTVNNLDAKKKTIAVSVPGEG